MYGYMREHLKVEIALNVSEKGVLKSLLIQSVKYEMAIGNSFFYRFVVALVCVLSTDAATLGQNCNATITCTGDHVVCSDTYTCVCDTGYQQNSAGNGCAVGLSSQCRNPASDKCLDPNAVCTYESTVFTCLCNNSYYNNGGTCVLKVALGGTCPTGTIGTCLDTNANCTGTCTCKSTHYNNNGKCEPKVGLGSACPQPDACGTTNAVCSNTSGGGTCVCGDGYYDSNGNTALDGSCLFKVGLGSACPQPDACGILDAVCSIPNGGGTCICGNGYYDSNGITLGGNCLTKTALGEQCPQPDACQPQYSECGSRTECVCSASYFDSNGVSNIGGSCSAKLGLGFSCTQIDACSDINANCNQTTCVCNTGYYDSNGSGTNGGICELKVGLGKGCPRPDACATPNSMCSNINGGGTCICSSVYYDYYGSCLQKVQLGSACYMPAACAAANSGCIEARCQCLSGYYDDTGANIGGSCQYRLILNSQCDILPNISYSQRDQCQDRNAECYFNSSYSAYSCTCKGGYYPEGSTCVADKPLGGNCTYKTDCSDPNANCTGRKCTCDIKYYDSNGLADGGNCMPMSDLKVTGITFSYITMSSIKVMWTLPAASTFINALVVAWGPSSGTGQTVSETLSSPTETSYTISSQIEPGRAYRISIISKNTETDLTSTRETETISYQAASPNRPGPLQLIDLDASDRMITLGWPPVSNFSKLHVLLKDGSVVLGNDYPNTTSWTLSNNTLLNGHRYNVTLYTISEYFKPWKSSYGYYRRESYMESIKTTVQIPGPPESPQCMTGDFYSILLKWSPPTFPNGDLVQYHIEVFEKDKPINAVANYRTGNTSTAYTVTGLKAGFNYFFKVTTENEMYNSTSVEANNCNTIAERSGKPTNLTVTGVTSRSMNVAWSYPERTNSEEILGYILQIKDTSSSCVHEQLFKCKDCIGSFQDPVGVLCPVDVRQADIFVSKHQLKERQVYNVTGLLPDIEYTISVSAVNLDGQGNISFLVHRIDEEGIESNQGEDKGDEPILGGVIGGIFVLAVIGATVGFIIYRKRKLGPNSLCKLWENKSLNNGYNEDRLATPRNRPVKLSEFPTYVADMHEELNLKFSRSFEDLKAVSLNLKQSVATETKNQMKNRDMHVLPYDHSRVVLRSEHGMDDYINASFLPGYRSAREYIGCQGPLSCTVNDFWRMVWEQNVSTVVMLTLCQEHNEVKCEQYWSSVINEPKQLGDVEVQLISSSSFPSYNYNVMKLVSNGRPRILEHFQFLSWRNMTTNDALIDFIIQVRKHVQPPDTAGPMLVHCSNGAERTGIYIILDHLMQFIDDHDFGSSIDIFGMVLKLRENRPNTVETLHQYEFIHDCINTILARKDSASSQGNTYETIKSSELNAYQNQQEHAYAMLEMN